MVRLRQNIVYNLVGQCLLLIIGFIGVKYVFRQLGEDALGIIYFSLTLSALMGAIMDAGASATTVRQVSAHIENEPEYIHDLLRMGSLLYWGAYVLLAATVWFGAPYVVKHWLILKSLDMEVAARALQILGVGALLGLPRSLYGSLFRGLQRMEYNNLIDVTTMGAQQLGTIAILLLGGDLIHVVCWLAVGFSFGILTYIVFAGRFVPWSALAPGYSSKVVRRNLIFSANMTGISILATIHTQIDKVFISALLPLGTLGVYGFVYGAMARASVLTGAISQAVFPSFSTLISAGDQQTLKSQYRKYQEIVCLTSAPLFACGTFAAVPLLTFIFNEQVARQLLLPTLFLAIGFYMNSVITMPYIFSLAVGRPDISTKSNFLALFIITPITAVCIYYWGLVGAGLSWIGYHLFAYAYAVPRICIECLEMPVWDWYVQVLQIFGLVSLTYGIAWVVVVLGGSYTIQTLGIAYCAASLGFLFGAYRWLDGERRGFVDMATTRLMKLLPL